MCLCLRCDYFTVMRRHTTPGEDLRDKVNAINDLAENHSYQQLHVINTNHQSIEGTLRQSLSVITSFIAYDN